LLDDSPEALKDAYRIARRTFLAVKENLALSLLYNLIAVPVAIAGYVTPLVAAASMSLSSLIVVGNSMRIKRLRFDKKR
jgi:Cu+-exporting ATPase